MRWSIVFILSFGLLLSIPAPARARVEETKRSAYATPGPFGLGAIIGDPTGITGKYWFNSERALDFGLSFFEQDYFLTYVDYLVHFPGLFGHRNRFFIETTPYMGIGGLIAAFSGNYYRDGHEYYWHSDSKADLGLGVRAPFGAEWRPSRVPVGVFVELAPGIALIPGTDFFVQFGTGARYYF